jgi:hypothetical protein
MTDSTPHEIEVPRAFLDSCENDSPEGRPLIQSCGEHLQLGSYDFLIAQAKYFAWPHLTEEILAGACAHEEAHNCLTMATALGHLALHLKTILELASKIPPDNNLAKTLGRYLSVITRSSRYAQETAATMSAYCALRESYGQAAADRYLKAHEEDEPAAPSPYTTFVNKAIKLFRKHEVPEEHWSGYMMWLASLALNTDIDMLAAALPDLARFEELCTQSPLAGDLRFIRMFGEWEQAMTQRGLPAHEKEHFEHRYNHVSKVMSGDLPRLLAEALNHQGAEFQLSDYDRAVLDHVRENPRGFPGRLDVQTVFYASQPPRKATAANYLFHMDHDTCAECDLVEMGLAVSPDNSTYGGISINLYAVASPPVKTCFWMLHPCCAVRCGPLLRDKTLVVYFTHDFLMGGDAVEPIRRLIRKRKVIYVFFGNHGKFLLWLDGKERYLTYTTARMRRPPIRFVLFRDRRRRQSTYVLPIAPVRCDHVDSILSTIRQVPFSEFADVALRTDLDRFFRWYVCAPVTC